MGNTPFGYLYRRAAKLLIRAFDPEAIANPGRRGLYKALIAKEWLKSSIRGSFGSFIRQALDFLGSNMDRRYQMNPVTGRGKLMLPLGTLVVKIISTVIKASFILGGILLVTAATGAAISTGGVALVAAGIIGGAAGGVVGGAVGSIFEQLAIYGKIDWGLVGSSVASTAIVGGFAGAIWGLPALYNTGIAIGVGFLGSPDETSIIIQTYLILYSFKIFFI